MTALRVSSAATWARCRRKFAWSQEWDQDRDRTAADIGTVVHGDLAKWYGNTPYDEETMGAIDRLSPEDLVTAGRMFDTYVNEVEQEGLDVGQSTASVENRYFADIAGQQLTGRVDHVYYDETLGGNVIRDHKTVGQFFTTAPRDFQLMCYAWLARHNGVKNIVYIEHNQIKRNKRTPGAKPPYIHRSGSVVNDKSIEAFGAELAYMLGEMGTVIWNSGMDVEYFGLYPIGRNDCSYTCSFKDICGMVEDGGDYLDVLNTEYRRREDTIL